MTPYQLFLPQHVGDPASHGPILLLVDGHNLAYRAYHAIAHMNAPDGQPTQALFGFIRTLEGLLTSLSPSHVCVVFDGGLPKARMAILQDYKAQRPPMPDDLHSQFSLIETYLDAAGIRHMRIPGEEADDLLATLAHHAQPETERTYLASTDRDFMQLVTPKLHLVEPSRNARITDPDEVERKTGVPPARVLLWRALVGDTSDNIKGVPGIGPKTAARLLQEYATLEDIWAHLPDMQPTRTRDALKNHRERIERNLSLMRLQKHVSCPIPWYDCERRPEDREELSSLLRRAGFLSMLRKRDELRLW